MRKGTSVSRMATWMIIFIFSLSFRLSVCLSFLVSVARQDSVYSFWSVISDELANTLGERCTASRPGAVKTEEKSHLHSHSAL